VMIDPFRRLLLTLADVQPRFESSRASPPIDVRVTNKGLTYAQDGREQVSAKALPRVNQPCTAQRSM
jgi:hypothetical protein